jgi:hypothetical protein
MFLLPEPKIDEGLAAGSPVLELTELKKSHASMSTISKRQVVSLPESK